MFSSLVNFLLLLMTGFTWWQPLFPCQEHLPDEVLALQVGTHFLLLVAISLLDIINSNNNWGLGLWCLDTSIFIKTRSLEGLPTKAKEDPSPHEMRLSPVGHQPSISWSRGKLLLLFLLLLLLLFIFFSLLSSPIQCLFDIFYFYSNIFKIYFW